MAAETKLISTVTTKSVVGTSIAIKTEYMEDELPDTILGVITSDVGNQDGVPYIEGELLIQMKNSPEHLSYSINNNGELILVINTGDELKYSIDANGDLIYTF